MIELGFLVKLIENPSRGGKATDRCRIVSVNTRS